MPRSALASDLADFADQPHIEGVRELHEALTAELDGQGMLMPKKER
jgi:hypothetical protein